MKSQSKPTPKCHSESWRQLLDDSLSVHQSREIEEHVENCPDCQQRLEQHSGEMPHWWDDAKDSWLEEELPSSRDPNSTLITIEIGRSVPEDSLLELERVSLDFLSQASHPEMLGRLGRYDIERVIGTGGMGVVLKAFDTELHRVVAIKVLAQHLASNGSARRRFSREAQAAAAVLHPNVIPIYNVEQDDELPYLVMQCVNGKSLQGKVDEHGPLSVAEALRIAKQTAAGLAAAHEQWLVHRDVKPANILLEENVDRVLLSDFGLARAVDDASLTRTGVVAGTPHYMSPEQARGDAIRCDSDQFSLGSVMYFMLTGHPPFRAENAMGVLNRICHDPHRPIEAINADVPVEVSDLIDRLLSKSPKDRFPSAIAVEKEVDRLLALLQSGGLSLQRRGQRKKMAVSQWFALAIVAAGSLIALMVGQQFFRSTKTEGRMKRSSEITVRELASIKAQLQASQAELNEFDATFDRTRQQLMTLESTWQSFSSIPIDSIDAEVARLRADLQSIREETDSVSSPIER
ncbi:MAG: protein kinase domain-containing protein [Pirellula sp.]